jgi:uncharacterized protein YndB with AHSA1/START domain
MKDPLVEESVDVAVGSEDAFVLWTDGINDWWRRGTPYWNDKERAVGLHFEPWVGGRFIEVYDAERGEGFEIGRVTEWEPGRRLGFTWRQADWDQQERVQVEVLFEPRGGTTRVTMRFTGWERVSDGPEMAAGYGGGTRELLGWYRDASAKGLSAAAGHGEGQAAAQ